MQAAADEERLQAKAKAQSVAVEDGLQVTPEASMIRSQEAAEEQRLQAKPHAWIIRWADMASDSGEVIGTATELPEKGSRPAHCKRHGHRR